MSCNKCKTNIEYKKYLCNYCNNIYCNNCFAICWYNKNGSCKDCYIVIDLSDTDSNSDTSSVSSKLSRNLSID